MSTKVRDVMTTRVVAVFADASFKEMASRLRRYGVSAFPVLDRTRKVIGVVSEADLLAVQADPDRRPGPLTGLRHYLGRGKLRAATAGDLMTSPAVTIGPEQPAADAARLMYSKHVKRLPVADDFGRLVGIVSRADVLSVFSRPDEEIRSEIIYEVITDQFLTDPHNFTITVRQGIVTLEGHPETAEVGRGIVADARHVDGVVTVRDRLTYPAYPQAGQYPGQPRAPVA